ncbi:hypothetical protein [Oceanobacillus sp. FSL H7-0719]|uniref:hypothetical protein n=1 Tax=Oceanobacillus sp. FSL H7-0719 TaxID=2954507 RepID=UPI0032547B12
MDDVIVFSVEQKLVIVEGQEYLCEIVRKGKGAMCRGENIKTNEKTEWVEFDDWINAAFKFGDYLKRHM